MRIIVSPRRLFANTPKRTPSEDDHRPETEVSVQAHPLVLSFPLEAQGMVGEGKDTRMERG
jgi:hypothetical protein